MKSIGTFSILTENRNKKPPVSLKTHGYHFSVKSEEHLRELKTLYGVDKKYLGSKIINIQFNKDSKFGYS